MTVTRTSPLLLAFALVSSLAITARAADDGLTREKDLYLSAAYEDALNVLDGLTDQPQSTEVEEYRAFCLLALQRTGDARKAIATVVSANPFYQPSESLASPRVRAVFREVRQSLLPVIVQQSYTDAKAAFDRKDPHAADLFDRLLLLLDDPDVKGQPALADLRTVATGFRDLSKAIAITPPLEAKTGAPAPAGAARSAAQAVMAVPSQDAVPSQVVDSGEAHGPNAGELTPPVAISQELPRWVPPRSIDTHQGYNGTLELTIDERGHVVSATVTKSVHPVYDALLVRAARSWKFKPALRNGVPTTSSKVLTIQLRPGDATIPNP
jgi:TonB family protein